MKIDNTDLLTKYQAFKDEYESNFAKYATRHDLSIMAELDQIVNRDYSSMTNDDILTNACGRIVLHGSDRKIRFIETDDLKHTAVLFNATVHNIKITMTVNIYPDDTVHVSVSLTIRNETLLPVTVSNFINTSMVDNPDDTIATWVNNFHTDPLIAERVAKTIMGVIKAVREYRKIICTSIVVCKKGEMKKYLIDNGLAVDTSNPITDKIIPKDNADISARSLDMVNFAPEAAIPIQSSPTNRITMQELADRISVARLSLANANYENRDRFSVYNYYLTDDGEIGIVTNDVLGDHCCMVSLPYILKDKTGWYAFNMIVHNRHTVDKPEHIIYYDGTPADTVAMDVVVRSVNTKRLSDGDLTVDIGFIKWSHDLMLEVLRQGTI